MEEVWKDAVGYEGLYQVSDQGRVKHLPRRVRFVSKVGKESWRVTSERICAGNVTREGYVIVHMMVLGVRHAPTAHALVMAAFIGPRPEGLQINHLNGVKLDNCVSNLEYVTCSENHRHAVRIGLNKQARSVTALTGGVVVARYDSMAEAARAVGGSVAYAIQTGRQTRGFHWALT